VGRLSPIFRLSLGLTVVTCSLLLIADFLGILPPLENAEMRRRIALCETISVQTAQAASHRDVESIRSLLALAVRREETLLSAGVRAADGTLIVQAGDHRNLWTPPEDVRSTETHMRVPLFRDGKEWAQLEVRFAEVPTAHVLAALWSRPLVRLVLAMSALGFVANALYLRRSLRHLDPSAVIPARVQAALDIMAEGVVLLDANQRIVLANAAFAERLGATPASLLGVDIASLGWRADAQPGAPVAMPWRDALRQGVSTAGTTLRLATRADGDRVFLVNASPVLDGWNRPKGAIATFDDATELERKTAALEQALAELEKSRDEIRLQNDELQVLARRDPLTGVANRRSFVPRFETLLAESLRSGRELSCVMVDIDHFKRVNDQHGHAMGDEVISRVARALAAEVGSSEDVCRYGGEEFCVVLPGTPVEEAMRLAERVRNAVQLPGFARVSVAVSAGVSSTRFGARQLGDLIEQADGALYASKQNGRNCVTSWADARPA
jgi:diguanylate cyclase (GGDEF)-like protein/PAS domain S-box-containing protein